MGTQEPLTAETLAVSLCKIMWQEEQHLGLTNIDEVVMFCLGQQIKVVECTPRKWKRTRLQPKARLCNDLTQYLGPHMAREPKRRP